MAFEDNLKRLRIAKGFDSRRHFAEKVLNIPYTTYNGYEVRGSIPPPEIMIKIAKALEVSIDELYGYNPETKERDIDTAIKLLKKLGIKTVIYEEDKKVGIYIRKDTQFTVIPFSELVNMINDAKGLWFLNITKNHVLYSYVMSSIINYAESTTSKKRSFKKVRPPEDSKEFSEVVKDIEPYSKKERNDAERFAKRNFVFNVQDDND